VSGENEGVTDRWRRPPTRRRLTTSSDICPHLSSAASTASEQCSTLPDTVCRAGANGGRDGTITPYETANGRRCRVRDRKPDSAETQQCGFATMREAKLYLSMVTVSKSKGEYIDPVVSRVPVRMFVNSWLR
jgi:hypothetical protein